ncbi:MAG: hypothetical protein A2Z90_14510 [Burkholderiales bacterium GWA2_64_37]|nr:MAG: hypothetical protein A2Z90_14510 [Burkholderiales bacterium GWA2_64_37]
MQQLHDSLSAHHLQRFAGDSTIAAAQADDFNGIQMQMQCTGWYVFSNSHARGHLRISNFQRLQENIPKPLGNQLPIEMSLIAKAASPLKPALLDPQVKAVYG